MWGIIPAAGAGTRIQPLAFSKELLPMCGRGNGAEHRPRAVSDYLVERLVRGGATRICFVISPGKSDILEYYGASAYSAALCYVIQPKAVGLCDSIFRALPVIDKQAPVLVGLPDTIWFPESALSALPDNRLSFLLFPVERPANFDAVLLDDHDRVIEIQVKHPSPSTRWVWGAFKMPGLVLEELFNLWHARQCVDEYIGTLVNAWLANGGEAYGFRIGQSYFDVGTMNGYLEAMRHLSGFDRHGTELVQEAIER
ncbi:MAG TPA: sugar phosphate nucleotidyltransferase [Bryobacteraceae bacterium]|jgi:dTDP-glucose pyrophosphorylase|nr:sugar phosphate nucleotidyltransferase [Bryobacteraceae bacterium]